MAKAILAVLLTVGVVAGLIVFIGSGGGHSDKTSTGSTAATTTSTTVAALTAEETAEKAEAEAWSTEVSAAFGGEALTTTIRDLLSSVDKWKRGEEPVDQLKEDLAKDLELFSRARNSMRTMRPYPKDDRVKELYVQS